MRIKLFLIAFLLISLITISCKKFVEIPLPDNQLTTDFVFSNDNTAIQTITGIYSNMMNNSQQFSCGFITFFAGMSADELYYYTSSTRDEFLNNQISTINHPNLEVSFWNSCYQYIYASNKCIEGASASTQLSPAIKNLVIGEARFIRAFCYYYLTSLFGDVPLVISTNYNSNQSLPRTSQDSIYSQIIKDLKEAKDLLSINYPAVERTRPNKYAATALLARIYLFKKDWRAAETEASEIINSGMYSINSDLSKVFQINSNETIWQLRPVNTTRNTWEGNTIIPSSNSTTPTYLFTSTLINSFEPGDMRKINWTKSRSFLGQTLHYPYKYKVRTGSTLTEYYVVLRLAEIYLIRSEARIMQNNQQGALYDLNIIRQRAGLINSTAISMSDILLAIEQERKIEYCAEWGARWFDLKRTGRASVILSALKPSTWQDTDVLWPIPQSQINLNPSLTQNAGY
jgi:starch-binding outer membrane protein, SusD/RagB family